MSPCSYMYKAFSTTCIHCNLSLCIKFFFVCNTVTALIKHTAVLCTVQHCKVMQTIAQFSTHLHYNLCTQCNILHLFEHCNVCTAPMHLSRKTAVSSNLSTFCFHELIHKDSDLASRANVFINHPKILLISKQRKTFSWKTFEKEAVLNFLKSF